MRKQIILNASDLMHLIGECITCPKFKGKMRGGRTHTKRMIAESIVSELKGDYKKSIRESKEVQTVAERLQSYQPAIEKYIEPKS